MTESNTPLGLMTQRGPTVLWNDSATFTELTTAISWGAVGAPCNPVTPLAPRKPALPKWSTRIREYAAEHPTAEYEETRDKARALLTALQLAQAGL